MKQVSMFLIETQWREIPFSTKYEMSSDGEIRDVKTRKPRKSKGALGYRKTDGKFTTISIWKTYKLVWPELQ